MSDAHHFWKICVALWTRGLREVRKILNEYFTVFANGWNRIWVRRDCSYRVDHYVWVSAESPNSSNTSLPLSKLTKNLCRLYFYFNTEAMFVDLCPCMVHGVWFVVCMFIYVCMDVRKYLSTYMCIHVCMNTYYIGMYVCMYEYPLLICILR